MTSKFAKPVKLIPVTHRAPLVVALMSGVGGTDQTLSVLCVDTDTARTDSPRPSRPYGRGGGASYGDAANSKDDGKDGKDDIVTIPVKTIPDCKVLVDMFIPGVPYHDTVLNLIAQGAALNLQNRYGSTALMLAIMYNNPEIVQELLRAGAALNLQDSYGRTALIYAIMYSLPLRVQELLRAGAALNLQDSYGRTALVYATMHNCFEIVQELIRAGADLDVQDNRGRTVLQRAQDNNSPKIVQELIAATSPMKTLSSSQCSGGAGGYPKDTLEVSVDVVAEVTVDLDNMFGRDSDSDSSS